MEFGIGYAFARALPVSRLKPHGLSVLFAASKAMIRDRCHGLGAALSYFALLAIPSFVAVTFSMTSLVFGEEIIRDQLLPFLHQRLDPWESELLKYLVTQYKQFDWSDLSTNLLGLAAFIFGATEFTIQLKDSLETVWGKRTQETTFKEYFSDLFKGFAIAILIAAYFFVSVGARIWTRERVLAVLPIPFFDYLYSGILVMVLSAFLFKYFARSNLRWRHVWSGAFFTALFCELGRLAVARYLAREEVAGLSGSGGSIMIFLAWSFYFSQIFLFGAQITRALQRDREGLPLYERVEFVPERAA